MTIATRPVSPVAAALSWHRPLVLLAAAMAVSVSALSCLVGLLVDHRSITNLPAWDKPFKFSISVGVYALTWAWLIQALRRGQRWAHRAGTVAAVLLGIEMIIIIGQTARGTTSHFNLSTGFDAAMWTVMGGSIAGVWVATLVITVMLFANPGPDAARNRAVRVGAVLAVVGMALGFLMTIPTQAQVVSGQGIFGAHTVGRPDGGPGLPFLGWSTTGGDLRLPHFVGMHALQAIPLLLIGLELLGRRIARLAAPAVRARLIMVAALGYAGLIVLLTWQALRGQSVVAPDRWTTLVLVVLVLGVTGGVGRVLSTAPAGSGAAQQQPDGQDQDSADGHLDEGVAQ